MPYKDTEKQRAWQRANGKKHRQRWAATHPEYAREKARLDRQNKPERIKAIRRKHRYGELPPEPLNCEACRIPFAETKKGSCVDHDHASSKVRGYLCNDCNLALGRLHDDPYRIKALLAYLVSR